MLSYRLIYGLLMLSLAVSCVERLDTPEIAPGGLVPVQLAFSLQGEAPATKADTTKLSEIGFNPQFRGMDSIFILPLVQTETISAGDNAVTLDMIRPLSSITAAQDEQAWSGSGSYHKGLIRNSNAHLYPSVYLPEETASVLVYGQAPRPRGSLTYSQYRHRYGSLLTEGLYSKESNVPVSSIRFRPETIYSSAASGAATRIANLLTTIVTTDYRQDYFYFKDGDWHPAQIVVRWNETIGDPILRRYFNWITGEGQLMTGVGRNVENMISTLHRQLVAFDSYSDQDYKHVIAGVEYTAVLTEGGTDTFTYKYLYNNLRDAILQQYVDLVDNDPHVLSLVYNPSATYCFTYEDDHSYPSSLGLPDGAAVLRWNGSSFYPVTEYGLDGIAAMDHYCYMPALFYYVNSTLKTDHDRDIYQNYTSSYSWNEILSNYKLGSKIGPGTRAVALIEPLRYACGKCVVTVRATQEHLPDNDGDTRTYCVVGTNNFPVTGIIIGSQYPQYFDFTPDVTSDSYSLYDNDLYDTDHDEQPTCLVRAESAAGLKTIQTLALQTPPGEDVYFCLEFRNDSGKSFTGVDGIVLPGNHFYMTGTLKLTDLADKAFSKHSVTTVDCIISSMENAHVCVPDLGSPQLTIGVQTQINWKMSTPAQIPLE